ncbi:MAG: GspH/FimT family pseudopilin [Vicinamibacteraceae bacterium]
MRRLRGEQAGWSLVELVMVIGVSLVVGAMAMAALAPLGAAARALGAARALAAMLQRERLDAVRTGRVCGIRFDDDGSGIGYTRVTDGNDNGLRSAEVVDGTDPRRGPRQRLSDAFAGVRFAIVDDVPSIDGGAGLSAGADPVRIGSSILAFAPTGGATSGTLYLASADRRQFAVRVLGATGRVRIFEFDRAMAAWVSR